MYLYATETTRRQSDMRRIFEHKTQVQGHLEIIQRKMRENKTILYNVFD